MTIKIDVKALVSDAVKNLETVNDKIDDQDKAVNRLAKAQHDLEASSLKLADAQTRLAKNTDPAKQHELEGAILAARVALDKQGDEVNRLAREYTGLEGGSKQLADAQTSMVQSLVDVKAGVDLAVQAFGYMQQAFDATVIRAANWGDSMGDLASLTGESVEDTSRLAATLELVGVDADKLGRILKTMTSQGLNLNLKTLMKLNEEYNALQDPVERNAFLFKNFGKAAEDMAEVMGRSQAELEALTAAAEKSGKVIGEKAAAQAEKFNVQLAIAQQQLDGVQTQLGGVAIQLAIVTSQGLRDAIKGFREWSNELDKAGSMYDYFSMGLATGNPKLIEAAAAFDEVSSEAHKSNDAINAWRDRWEGISGEAQKKALDDARIASEKLRDELGVLNIALTGAVSNAQQEFYDNQKDVSDAIVDTKDKIKELEDRKYLTQEQKDQLAELKLKLEEQMGVLEENRVKWTETTNSIIFDMIRQAYAADGSLSQPEIASLREIGVELGIYDQKTADVMQSVQDAVTTGGVVTRDELQRILDKYGAIRDEPDITKRITVETHYVKFGDENPSYSGGGGTSTTIVEPEDDEPVGPGYAQGGSFVVPGSGSGDRPYTVNLTPGERVDVTPVNQVGKAGSRSTVHVENINITAGEGVNARSLVDDMLRELARQVRAQAATANW